MARSPRKSRGRSVSRQGSRTKKGLTILRRKGLIGKEEFRSDRPTKAARKIVTKYKDVIEGRAVVVKPKTRLIPAHDRKLMKERRGKLVVPKVPGTVSTQIKRIKTGKRQTKLVVERTRRTRAGLVRETVQPSIELGPLPKGKAYRVTSINSPHSRRTREFFDPNAEYLGRSRYFVTKKSLEEFLEFYDNSSEYHDISIVTPPSLGVPA